MPVLSIVIPAYNEARFIGRLLQQIKAVDLSRFGLESQILVVDDCSTDSTAAIVEAEPGVTLIRMPQNGGKGKAVTRDEPRARVGAGETPKTGRGANPTNKDR